MTGKDQKQPGRTLWSIPDRLHGTTNADDSRDRMPSFLLPRCPRAALASTIPVPGSLP